MAEETRPARPDADESRELADLRQRHAELEIVFRTISDVVSTLAVHEVLQRLLDRTLSHLDSEIGSILLVAPDGSLTIAAARGLPETVVKETRLAPGEGISGFVAASREPLLVEDIESDARFQRRNRERYYTRSLLSAPMILQDRVRGVVNVNNKRTREKFTASDQRLLQAIASHAAVALANAERYEEMVQRAQHDALTGLANHGHFWSLLEIELQRAERYARELSVVMIDVDDFKGYNDRHGHMAGDEVLKAIAGLIRARCRSSDLAARYGGEEFALVLPETSLDGALAFGEKIRQSIESRGFDAGAGARLTVSVGIGTFPAHADTPRALVEAADRELYRAKSGGRNRVCAPDR